MRRAKGWVKSGAILALTCGVIATSPVFSRIARADQVSPTPLTIQVKDPISNSENPKLVTVKLLPLFEQTDFAQLPEGHGFTAFHLTVEDSVTSPRGYFRSLILQLREQGALPQRDPSNSSSLVFFWQAPHGLEVVPESTLESEDEFDNAHPMQTRWKHLAHWVSKSCRADTSGTFLRESDEAYRERKLREGACEVRLLTTEHADFLSTQLSVYSALRSFFIDTPEGVTPLDLAHGLILYLYAYFFSWLLRAPLLSFGARVMAARSEMQRRIFWIVTPLASLGLGAVVILKLAAALGQMNPPQAWGEFLLPVIGMPLLFFALAFVPLGWIGEKRVTGESDIPEKWQEIGYFLAPFVLLLFSGVKSALKKQKPTPKQKPQKDGFANPSATGRSDATLKGQGGKFGGGGASSDF
jgi:hypothetical protein